LDKPKDRGYSEEGVGLTSKEHQHVNLVHRLQYKFLVVHTVRDRFLPHMVPLLLLLLNPHTHKTFHLDLLLILKNLHPHVLIILKTLKKLVSPHPDGTQNIPSPPTPSPEKTEKLASPHPQETPNIPSPPPRPPPPPPSSPNKTTKPTPPSPQNNHAKAGTSRPNASVIGPGETPLLLVNQSDLLAGADKSINDTSKKVVGTSGPNTFVIAPGETPLGKKALEKPSDISNRQGKKFAGNKISTPRTTDKKSLEKPSAISKLQEEKLAKNKSSTPPTAGKQALKKPSSAISKQHEKRKLL
jgi:hypothetical protein